MPATIADLLRAARATEPPPKRQRQAGSAGRRSTPSYASTYRWTELQTKAVEEAEALRRAGRDHEARQCLAAHDFLPSSLKNDQIVEGAV